MEDKLRALHARSLELETQLQVEARGRRSAEEANRELLTNAENTRQSLRELQGKVCKAWRGEKSHFCYVCPLWPIPKVREELKKARKPPKVPSTSNRLRVGGG